MSDLLRPPPLREVIEAARVAALRSYGILEQDSARRYDAVCQAAAAALDATAACVSFLDGDWDRVKGRFGADMPDEPRHLSFSHHVIHEPGGVLAVTDLLSDARFSAHPSVLSGALHRSYAGVTIVDPGEYRIGTVAVLDRRRRQYGPDSLDTLRRLAVSVMDSLLPPRAGIPLLPLDAPVPEVLSAPAVPMVQGWLGVRTERALASLTAPPGVRLASVAQGGPAERAGLQPGDLLFAIQGQDIRESGDITRALAGHPAGASVPVNVWRAGEAMQRLIQIEAMPDNQRTRRRSSGP